MAIVKVTRQMAHDALRAIDWAAQDALTDEDIARQVAENPDSAPILSLAETAHALVHTVCLGLGLSQAAFAQRYAIPEDALEDWAANRNPPDRTVFSYLRVIAREPEIVARALLPGTPALSQPAPVM